MQPCPLKKGDIVVYNGLNLQLYYDAGLPMPKMKKGNTYTVLSRKRQTGFWTIFLVEFGKEHAFDIAYFTKPVNYSDITASLVQDAVQERLDVVKPLVKQLS